MANHDIKIVSFNINGVLNPIKRNKILSKMKKENAHVVFLQETHLNPIEHEKLKRMGFSQVYHSSCKSGHKRGVAILLSHRVKFEKNSEVKDNEGRYLLVSGKIEGIQITLLNVYAPPGSDFVFYRKMFDLMTEAIGILICGGDWNIRLNPRLDGSKDSIQTPIHKKLKILMSELGVLDLWRDFHPTDRDYTHYSHPHNVYSRIDYFFIFKRDRHRIHHCEIGNIDLSDHAPLSMMLQINNNPGNTLWRLNSNVLNNEQFKTKIKEEIKQYMEVNNNGEVGPEIVWDALKAVMRGKVISFCAYQKKQRQLRLYELNKELKELETKHKKGSNPNLNSKLKEVRKEINALYSQEIQKKMIYTKQKYYESGSKFAKLLARKLQKQQSDNTIYKIRDPLSKALLYKQHEIQTAFQNYYKQLYSQPQLLDEQQIEQFLSFLNLPTLSEDKNKQLKAEITKEELNSAISRLKSNKSPGPDGFSPEWYKTFRTELTPILLNIFNIALKEGKTPPTWTEATISVIPKEGKDRLDCGSYRPISVLNTDYKLYTSILAKRVEKVLPHLIHTDQTGFISQRQTHDNIRRSLHILSHIQKYKLQALLVSLDAEKAFDSVSWMFLYKTLERFGFHKEFIKGIGTLYNNPTARIKINGYLSDTIKLERGTRQGCGLSPLLFAIYIEPLAQWIRQSDNIKGITINGEQHKIALYADDILIYLKDPVHSLTELFKLLDSFGKYAGYKLNIQKTQILTHNYTPSKQLRDKYRLNWEQDAMKYLGVLFPKDISTLAKINYDPLLTRIKLDIQRWNSNPFMSFTQRVETIKMNILPRFLFLFQALPVEISTKQFSEWDNIISRFIWQGKKPRVRFKTLQLSKDRGGMAVPNLKDYFFSAQVRPLINLCNQDYHARWKDIELSFIKDPPLWAVLGNKDLEIFVTKLQNPWTKFQIKTWNSIKDTYKLHDKLGIIRWCAYDLDFKPNQLDLRFKNWITKGITTFYSIIDKGQLKSFQNLQRDHSLEKQDFYRYLQLRNYFEKVIRKYTADPEDPILKEILRAYSSEQTKGIISRIYKGFMTKKTYSTDYIKDNWEKEGNFEMPREEWYSCCEFQWKCTNSHTWREFAWKCLIRFFVTPKQKAHFAGGDPQCWRMCGGRDASHWHIFWECPVTVNFWSEMHKILENMFHIKIPYHFKTFILGEINFLTGHLNKYLFGALISAGKKTITRHWLRPDPPTIEEWIVIVDEIYKMEKITFSLRLQMDKFTRSWSKWVSYVQTSQSHPRN